LTAAHLSTVRIAIPGGNWRTIPLSAGTLSSNELAFQYSEITAGAIGQVETTITGSPAVVYYLNGANPLRAVICVNDPPEFKSQSYGCATGSTKLSASPDDPLMPSATVADTLHLSLFSGSTILTRVDGNLTSVLYSIGDVSVQNLDVTAPDDATDILLPLTSLAMTSKATQGVVVKVLVQANGEPFPLYFRIHQTWTPYGGAGFWLPVGLFSTNFKGTSGGGIPLAPAPIGLAWGQKRYVGDTADGYVGISAFANWTLTPAQDAKGQATGGYGVQALTFGALFDFANYVYAGPGFVKDWQTGSNDSGFVVVVGVGPKLLNVFKLLGGGK
jgi:hypothetical protein